MANELVNATMKFMQAGEYRKALDCIAHIYNDDKKLGYRLSVAFRSALTEQVKNGVNAADNYELLHQAYVLVAKDYFDEFMIALEWYRPAEQKFWLVRRERLLEVCEALQMMADGELDELFLSMPPRVGKALANDTPIYTRNGWKNHGDLVVGDEVVGLDGKFKLVTHVHPKCDLDVLVEFSNGEKIQCHERHEWMFYDRAKGKTETKEIIEWEKRKLDYGGEKGKRGHRYVLQLPHREYVVGEEKELPLDPYTLGVWLGDGTNRNPTIANCNDDKAIIEKIVNNGNGIHWKTKHKLTGVMYYCFGFRDKLKKYGMCHSKRKTEKYIPEEYLTSSIEQRLELLAGLIDTDGYLSMEEKRYCFSTSDERLKETFIELVSTFGWRTCVTYYEPSTSSSGITSRNGHYAIAFSPDCYIPCALERKQLRDYSMQRKISVTSIRRVEPKQGNCITVEGDGMYLCGKTMIPTHNTTLTLLYTLWVMCRDTERSNLYSSFTEKVVETYYNGIMEVMTDPVTYDLHTIFPKFKIASTNAKDLLVNLGRKKRYPSLTCRSIDGTLNGACDADGLIIADDLHSGIEEARSKEQLDKKWFTVTNNLLSRKKHDGKILWIGTRWSVADCISNRIEMLETNADCAHIRYKIVNCPAFNEKEESNFDYMFNKGFTTNEYKVIRASFELKDDMASWLAQYMGQPIERDGSVFAPSDMRYYNGELPADTDPDRIFMAVDPAWGGGDFVAAPIIYQYGDDLFVHDVVYNNGDKSVTEPMVVAKAIQHDVAMITVEATKTTRSYSEDIDSKLRERGYRLNIQTTTKNWTGTGKLQRIFDKSVDIKERMIFRDGNHRDKEYSLFMQNVFSFTVNANKHKHDDAPDSLCIAIQVAFFAPQKAHIRKRIF